MKKYLLIFLILTLFLSLAKASFAEEKTAVSSAKVLIASADIDLAQDNRVNILKKFLAERNSPLTGNAADFVKYADKYNLDWRLVAAISGLESCFGQEIPTGTYNGWGWGIYGTNTHYFTSWEDGIATVSKGLREQYMNEWGATNIYEVGSMYAASPTWAVRVERFMNTISDFALKNPDKTLSLTL